MHPEEPNPDDREAEIADDPLLSTIQGELHGINKRNDVRLLLVLALELIVVYVFKRLNINSVWLDMLEAVILISIVGGTIFSVVRQKRRVATRHGLVCSACGCKPKAFMIMSAAMTRRCRRCKSPLLVV